MVTNLINVCKLSLVLQNCTSLQFVSCGFLVNDNKVSFPRISDEGGAGCLEAALSPECSKSDIWTNRGALSLGSLKGMQSLGFCCHL